MVLEQDVLVTRFPCLHPGDVRKFRAVRASAMTTDSNASSSFLGGETGSHRSPPHGLVSDGFETLHGKRCWDYLGNTDVAVFPAGVDRSPLDMMGGRRLRRRHGSGDLAQGNR